MLRYLGTLLAVTLMWIAVSTHIPAQESEPPTEDVISEAPPPAAPQARNPADLLDPDLLLILERLWGPVRADEPEVTDGSNVTVLSVPEGYAVYSAAVGEISGDPEAGPELAVEDVVFTDEHFLGTTPLTMVVPHGDHVLAVRATSRQDGFDGGCVRKTTRDVITGGRRHAYHLYPLRKREGQYQCFIACFVGPRATPEEVGLDLAERGTYAVPEDELIARLAASSGVSADDRERVARRLNQLGLAFYDAGHTQYIIKLVLVGNDYQLLEWAVE